MRTVVSTFLLLLLLAGMARAASKPHLITFGKATTVKWFVGVDDYAPLELRVRPLLVDARVREFTSGLPHDITDRFFAVRRVFRVNDSLTDETQSSRLWKWERGGWLLVDRLTGRIAAVNLPEFDPYFSPQSWYRDYLAYCGVSEDGKKISAMVMQVGRRKPLLKKVLDTAFDKQAPDSACVVPVWQRQPTRVMFEAGQEQKFTFLVRSHSFAVENDDGEGDPAQ